MEIYALDRGFKRDKPIENFISAIWTERFKGDDDFEISVPATKETTEQLAPGTLMQEVDSAIPMIIEDANTEEGVLTVNGISIVQWLNNRFIRASPYASDTTWLPGPLSPGNLIRTIVQNWCIDSSYLVDPTLGTFGQLPDDPDIMGIERPSRFKMTGLSVMAYDDTLPVIEEPSVPYGPVYDAIKDIAEVYSLGLKIKLESVTDLAYALGFYVYLGKNRTFLQDVYPPVRFSPDQNSLLNIKRLESVKDYKTVIYGYAPNVDEEVSTFYPAPGFFEDLPTVKDFDLKTSMNQYDDIDQSMVDPAGDTVPLQAVQYKILLTQKLHMDQLRSGPVRLIDGEIVKTSDYKYGIDYNLGDLIEMEAFEGVVSRAKVIEYIRSQDAAGSKEYPTVALVT